MKTYTPTIGIEVHAELKTKSKMFCGCKNEPHDGTPNTNICPVCLAHPGTLPVVNKEAIKKILEVGVALGGEIANYSEFDRKNYFYPDIPKAYQLSQYAYPFVKGGSLNGIAITRVHLEEDTARSQHIKEDSVVDFNRAGVPLLELVTEPVIHDSKVAADFARELQLLFKTLRVSEANMEKGEMRVEANISISDSEKLGTKVEVKNLNSFKAVHKAIEFEVKRQKELLDKGEKIKQETRGWDENKGKTFAQRSKETAEDYRYFPDPDIPKYQLQKISEFDNSRLKEKLTKLPSKIRQEFNDLGLNKDQIETLLFRSELMTFFEAVRKNWPSSDNKVKLAASYITSDINGILTANANLSLNLDFAALFARLISMLQSGEINSRVAKDLIFPVVFEGVEPEKIISKEGLSQQTDGSDLLAIIDEVISVNETVVNDYKTGKDAALQYLVGQGMKATKGTANPSTLSELLKKKIRG